MTDSKAFRCGAIVGQGHGDSAVCGQPNYGTDSWQCRACALDELRQLKAENERVTAENEQLAETTMGQENVIEHLEAECRSLKDEIATDDKIIAERDRLLNMFECPAHGQCVPYAMEQVEKLRSQSIYWQCAPGLGIIRCVSDARYRKFSPNIRKYYSPVLMVVDEALLKDAERYRFLRDHAAPSDLEYISHQVPVVIDEEIDAMIDKFKD